MDDIDKIIYDIAIVGAGPAGAIFAKELAIVRPDLKILLIDGQTSTATKPCGGLLSMDAQKLLAKLDLTLPKSILEDPQIFAVQTIDVEQKLVKYYQRYYINMDRYAFDKWLVSLLPTSVTLCKGKCLKIKDEGEVFSIHIKKDSYKVQANAKLIVGADGSNSFVRRTFFPSIKVQYVAIQQWFKNKGQKLPYYSCIFDAKTSDSCSWTIRKGDYVVFGGAFDKKDCRKSFDNQKTRLESFLGNSFGQSVKTEACLVSSPRKMKDFCTGKDRIFLLGEAAGFISSSSFEGLSSAILSGKLLAESFYKARRYNAVQRIYRKSTRRLRAKLYLKTLKRKLLCSSTIRKLIMKSGIQSISLYDKQT